MPAVLVAHPWLCGGASLVVLFVAAARWYDRRATRLMCDRLERPEYAAFLYALLTKRRWRRR